jgi:hypothetical protein
MSSDFARIHTPSAGPRHSGFDVGTLIIAAVASVVAATVVSRLWQAGTVMATAMTPVLVALVKEALERPARRVTSIASRSVAPTPSRTPRTVAPPIDDPELTPMRVYRRDRQVGRRWKLAIATGLLAFLIGVAVMTVPELVAGRSVVSGKHDTTIFGGQRRTSTTTSKPKTTTTEKQKAVPEVTPEKQTPQDTTTVPTEPVPQAQPAPQQQQTPAQPAPQTQPQTTPAPQQQSAPAPATP